MLIMLIMIVFLVYDYFLLPVEYWFVFFYISTMDSLKFICYLLACFMYIILFYYIAYRIAVIYLSAEPSTPKYI